MDADHPASGVKIARRNTVAALTRLSKPTIYKLVKQGQFPRQLRLCANKVAWLQSEVSAWIAARAEARVA